MNITTGSITINKTTYTIGDQYHWYKVEHKKISTYTITLHDIIETTFGITFAVIIISHNPIVIDCVKITELVPIK